MLRQFLEAAHRRARQHDPAQAPSGHAEILGEAIDHHDFSGKIERSPGLGAVRKPLVDLVDDEYAAALGEEARDRLQLALFDQSPCRVRRRAEDQSFRARAPGRAHHGRGRLKILRGRNGERPRAPLESAHEMAVAGISGIGHEHFVARVDIERGDGQESAGCACRHDDARRLEHARKSRGVMRGDRLAQRVQAERGRVRRAAFAQRAHAGLDHRRGRGEVGLADLHVHHAPARALEIVRARKHIHDFERFDFRGAARGCEMSGDGEGHCTFALL